MTWKLPNLLTWQLMTVLSPGLTVWDILVETNSGTSEKRGSLDSDPSAWTRGGKAAEPLAGEGRICALMEATAAAAITSITLSIILSRQVWQHPTLKAFQLTRGFCVLIVVHRLNTWKIQSFCFNGRSYYKLREIYILVKRRQTTLRIGDSWDYYCLHRWILISWVPVFSWSHAQD